MSSETARTTRPPAARRLVLGLVAAMLVAGCGSADDAPAAKPRGESVTDRGLQLVRVHYTRTLDAEGESYGVEMDVIARGADQSRTKVDWLVDGRVDESILFIRDGNRALRYSADAETPYTLMEAADEHLEDLPWESSPLDPDSDLLLRVCPSPDVVGTRTILGREAVGYACTWKDPGEGMDQPEKIWLDKATRMLLEYGPMKATEFVIDPGIDERTFSTKPPAGADVDVVKATGKGPPPPDQGEDEPAPEEGEIDTLGEVTSTNREAFYLGDEADGKHLAVVSELDGILAFEYGRCMDNNVEGGCLRPLNVSSQPTKNWGSRGESAGCKRLRPVLGVPAANMGQLTVFTGSSIVGISYLKAVSNGFVSVPSREAALAPQLRAVGQPTAAKTLPPPDPETQAFVDQHCGPEPK